MWSLRYAISIGNWVDRKHDPKRTAFGTGVLDDYSDLLT